MDRNQFFLDYKSMKVRICEWGSKDNPTLHWDNPFLIANEIVDWMK